MTSDIVDMVDFLLSGQLSIESLLIKFLFHLLEVSLLVGDLHVPETLLLLLLELSSILVNLQGLLIK